SEHDVPVDVDGGLKALESVLPQAVIGGASLPENLPLVLLARARHRTDEDQDRAGDCEHGADQPASRFHGGASITTTVIATAAAAERIAAQKRSGVLARRSTIS